MPRRRSPGSYSAAARSSFAPAILVCILAHRSAVLAEASSVLPDGDEEPAVFTSVIYDHVLPEVLLEEMRVDAMLLLGLEFRRYFSKGYMNHKATMWLSRQQAPRNSLEQAVRLLEELVRPRSNTSHYAGAEYWVQVIDTDQTIRFHVDKDEERSETNGELVHPWVSSVFYLKECGGCTLILDQAHPRIGDGVGLVGEATPPAAQTATLVCPRVNRFLVFNSSLVHGVLPGLSEDKHPTTTDNKRMTFLVNFWPTKPLEPHCRQPPLALRWSHERMEVLRKRLSTSKTQQPRAKLSKRTPAVSVNPRLTEAHSVVVEYEHRHQTYWLPRHVRDDGVVRLRWPGRAGHMRDSSKT